MIRIKAGTCEWMRRISLVLSVATFCFFWVSFADIGGAKSGLKWGELYQAGTALWVFLIVGAIIILLQLIPALILFFNFIGTGVHAGYTVVETKEKEVEVFQHPSPEKDISKEY